MCLMCYGTRCCALFDSPFLLQKKKKFNHCIDNLSKKIISFEYEVFVFVVRVLSLSVCVKSFEFPAVKFNSHHASSLYTVIDGGGREKDEVRTVVDLGGL